MKVYGEYHGGDRKATVTKINEHWHHHFDNWRVVFMQNGNPIQASSCKTEADAQKMAEKRKKVAECCIGTTVAHRA